MTQTQEHNLPALRFPEFNEIWNTKTIGNLGFTISDGNYGEMYPRAKQFVSSGVPFIRANNISNGKIIWTDMRFIDHELHGTLLSGHLELNDIIITTRGEIGTVALVSKEFVGANINAQICLIRDGNKCDQIFIFSSLQRPDARKQFKELTTGSALKQLPRKNLAKMCLSYPLLPEQQKISAFLTSVDHKITQLGQKKALLQRYKKGMMQKLFSGELRFKDAQGHDFPDWEEKRLGDVADFIKGKGISKSDIDDDGLTPCIRYGQLYTHYAETISNVVSKTNVPIKQLVLSKKNDVIIPASGETALDIATASCVTLDGVALGGDLNIIRSSLDGIFLAYYLNSDKKFEIARLAQGNSVVHLYAGQLKTLLLSIPSSEEEQKIANFLSSIDRKIDLISTELDHAKAFKKGLLQQMFI